MSTTLKIKVTKDVYEATKLCGKTDDCIVENCAIAHAVRDIFPNARVGYYDVALCRKPLGELGFYTASLPLHVADFIKMFDRASAEERPSLPEFEFEISIPDEVINKIDIESLKPLLENHPNLQLV